MAANLAHNLGSPDIGGSAQEGFPALFFTNSLIWDLKSRLWTLSSGTGQSGPSFGINNIVQSDKENEAEVEPGEQGQGIQKLA